MMNSQVQDNYTMSDAADLWGPKDEASRQLFIRGWKDQRAGKPMEQLEDRVSHHAYQSGYIIARETPVGMVIEKMFWRAPAVLSMAA